MQKKVLISSVLLALLVSSLLSTMTGTYILKNEQPMFQSNVVDRIVISSDTISITADEILQFSATLYTTSNTTIQDDVNWTASNGSISDDGIFYPWSSGIIEIEADYGGVTGSLNITVVPGAATSISIITSTVSVLEQNVLQAQVMDGRGNVKPASTQTVWDIDGTYIGTGSPIWIPEETGQFNARARLYQLETSANISVVAGSPHSFVFPDFMTVIAGETYTLSPQLLDINDYAMPISSAGPLNWWAESGTVNEQGNYSSTDTGVWNVTVTAGNVTGTGQIHVIPGSAVVSQVVIVDENDVYVAGQAYEVAVERRDINGYIGLVTPALSFWSVTSGGLSLDGNRVLWTPSQTGIAEISTTDDGISSRLEIQVVHGNAIDLFIQTSHNSPHAGDQIVLQTMATDVKGNVWVVNGTLDFILGDINELTVFESYTLLQASSIGSWDIEGSWLDEVTNTEFSSSISFDIMAGRLAFISLDGDGQIVPADQSIDLNPTFFDAYGNELYSIELNWSINGKDETLQMRLSGSVWSSSVLGGHEIRVNADGIFGTVRLNVVPGSAHSMLTNVDDGFEVSAGVPYDVFVEVIDIHGNIGESNDLTTSLDSTIGEIDVSDTGVGYWSFVGKTSGEYMLTLNEGNASHSIPLTILAGEPIRIRTQMQTASIAQGDIILIDVWGVDAYDNIVQIDHLNTTVTCTAGDATHVTGGTWEVEVSESGNDRACTILWEGLIAQSFFDVDEVLFGGAVGSTNTAIGMLTVLLLMLLVVMVVLVRKASAEPKTDWIEDEFEDDELDENEPQHQSDVVPGEPTQPITKQSTPPQHQAGPRPELDIAIRDELARQATSQGVMQAAPGTEQGKTGWYVNTKSGLEAWEVTTDGAWNKLE